MKVAITGASGLIGTALTASLKADGHEVLAVSRKGGDGRVEWNPKTGAIEIHKLRGCDAIINLAGANIAQRWSKEVKQEIIDSRILTTKLISDSASRLIPRPEVLISASAIGYYGPKPGQPVDESAAAGSGFLAKVCQDWEAATKFAEDTGIRVAHIRFGVVLSPNGGALAKMLPTFKSGLGGPIGSGKQMLSWIALDDVVRAIRYTIESHDIRGAVNATAPNPVSNADFATTLGQTLGKPTVLPAPAFALKLAMGEMVDETLLADQIVLPKVLEDTGFYFAYPEIRPALSHLLDRK